MTTEDAKTYLSKREIPRLFESLMTGLMYHRPTDHIKYLIDCLQKCHDKGADNITWSSFVDIRRTKTPLPPINDKKRPSSKEGSRPSSKTRATKGEEILSLNMSNLEEALVSRVISPVSQPPSRQGSVLSPPITRISTPDTSQGRQLQGSGREESSTTPTPREVTTRSPLPAIPTTSEKFTLPDIPVVLVIGAPGSEKEAHVGRLLDRYPGWEHICMGNLIKEEVSRRGDAQTKWQLTKDLMSRGEPANEEVTIETLVSGLKGCTSAKGLVITGFPRSIGQVSDYEKNVGRVDVAFMLDLDEASSSDRLLRKGRNSNKPEYSMAAIANKLNYFKAHTLAAAKSYDDQGKLVVIDCEPDENTVTYEIGKAFDKLFLSKYGKAPVGDAPPKSAPGTAKAEIPEASTYKGKYEKEDTEDDMDAPMYVGAVPEPPVIAEQDTGRKPGLPQAPIIFVAGGPGSGKGTQCGRIIKRYPDLVHLSMGDIIRSEISTKGTADDKWGMVTQLVSKGEMAPEDVTIDLLKEQLMKHKDAKGFLIEGFPRDKSQLEAFNKTIGGLNFVMLFDCEEYYMKTRLMKRGRESGRVDDNMTAIGNRLKFYKYNTIPLMKTFDDDKKLVVIDADRDMDEMFFDISTLFDFAFFKEQDTPAPESTTEIDEAAAATKIQAGFRGYMVRNKRQDEKKGQAEMEDKDTKKDSEAAPVQEEVVEPTITTEEASTTGDNVENPSHTKTLDETEEKS